MKQYFFNRCMLAGFMLLSVPATLLAQKEKVKEEKEQKDKNNVEQIIITRKGDTNEKTVIELRGDKVIINGKEAEDNKSGDVTVHRNRLRDVQALRGNVRINNGQNFNFDFDDDHISLFSEDANRAMLGVVTEATDDDDVKGAEITSVSKESAAEKAGLKEGDVITRIGDKKIEDADDVSAAVKSHKPGDKVPVTVLRNGKEQKITAELGKWKGVNVGAIAGPNRLITPDVWAPGTPATPFTYSYGAGSQMKLGMVVQDAEDGKGVKVLNVAEEGNAAKAGIKKDDVITQVDDEEVNSADEISQAMKDNKDKISVKMKLLRDGKTQTVDVKIPRRLKTTNL